MAQVTIELRNLLEIPTFSLWDFDYGISDLAWKARLEDLITNYFAFHEIGSETPDRFKHRFVNKMKMIMPYYNQLYNSTLFGKDPMLNHSMTETYTETADDDVDGSSSMSTTNDATADSTRTEYPQHVSITDDIPAGRAVDKADSITDQIGTTNQTRILNRTYTKTIEGATGKAYSELVLLHRSTIINIEKLIIADLKPLFILVY